MEKTLSSIYLDPSQPASFGGLDAVYRVVKEKGKSKISRKQVQDWLSQQDVYTLHKPARRHYKRSRVIVPGIDAQFQADLVDVQNLKRFNKGYKYLLTCIDIFSEEDRAFLDDEVSGNDPSFYRRLNVQLDTERRQERRQRREEIDDCEDMLFGEATTSDNKVLNELAEKLNAFIQELPVLGFNSGKYDLNAVKEFLFPYLIEHHPIKFTVKRNSNHMCLKTKCLKLLDITNYLAPGFSYDQFLKAYECEQTKGYFPYEWVDGLNKLEETSLPPHTAF